MVTISRRLLLSLAIATALSPAAFAQEPTLVRVALTPGTYNISIAEQEGFFARHGIRTELVQLATGTESIAAVKGGSADIAYADTFAGVNAIHNGFGPKLVAGANHTSQAVNYLVKQDSDVKTPEDLKARKLGIGGVPFFRVFANKYLESNGVQPADVNFTIIKQSSALPEALQNGAVDAIQSLGFIVAYNNDGTGDGYNFRTIGDPSTAKYQNPNAVQAGWWTSAEWADSNADTAQKFSDAYREFASWYNKLDLDKRVELAARFDKLDFAKVANGDPEKLKNLAFLTTARYVEGPVDVNATQEWIASGVKAAPEQVLENVSIADYLLPSAQ